MHQHLPDDSPCAVAGCLHTRTADYVSKPIQTTINGSANGMDHCQGPGLTAAIAKGGPNNHPGQQPYDPSQRRPAGYEAAHETLWADCHREMLNRSTSRLHITSV